MKRTRTRTNKKVPEYKLKNSLINEKYQKICERLIELEKSEELRKMSNKRLKEELEEELKNGRDIPVHTEQDSGVSGRIKFQGNK